MSVTSCLCRCCLCKTSTRASRPAHVVCGTAVPTGGRQNAMRTTISFAWHRLCIWGCLWPTWQQFGPRAHNTGVWAVFRIDGWHSVTLLVQLEPLSHCNQLPIVYPVLHGCTAYSKMPAFVYSFVCRGNVVLADYTAYTGNVTTLAVQLLDKCPTDTSKFTFACNNYTFNYLQDSGYSCAVVS